MQSYNLFYKNAAILIRKFAKNEKNNPIGLNVNEIKNVQQFVFDFLKKQKNITIICEDENQMLEFFEKIKHCFCFQKSAGGVVKFEDKLLIIKRFGIFDLPKGHVELGENDLEAAYREVEEETGISHLEFIQDLGYAYHIFEQNANFILKQTHWFLMKTIIKQKPIAQIEESITEAIWIECNKIDKITKNTYPSLLEIFEKVKK